MNLGEKGLRFTAASAVFFGRPFVARPNKGRRKKAPRPENRTHFADPE